MSTTLEPREVEKPFLSRWSKAAAELIVRAPLRFGIVIALLAALDTGALDLVQGSELMRPWIDGLGMILLPLLWALICALARGTDDASQTEAALRLLARRRVWAGAMCIGACLAAINCILATPLQGILRPRSYLSDSGQLMDPSATGVLLLTVLLGPCYLPLWTLLPDMSFQEVRLLSRKATEINGLYEVSLAMAAMSVGAWMLSDMLPAYGMTMAAFLVFVGVWNYVAYRDIFERRAANLPAVRVQLQRRADRPA